MIEVLMIISIYIMTIVLFGNVCVRLTGGGGIVFAEEVGRYCVVICTFLGASYVGVCDKHVKISLVFDLLPRIAQKITLVFINLISAGIMAYITFYCFKYYSFSISSGRTSASLGIPVSYVNLVVAFGFALLTIEFIIEAIMNIADKNAMYVGRNKLEINTLDTNLQIEEKGRED